MKEHSSDHPKLPGSKTSDQNPWMVHGNHVYPVNDLREHSMTDCWCSPVEDDGLVIHNSLDGRELYESGERKLS